MGLDIRVFKNLKVIENPQLDEDGYVENWETEWRPGGSMEWSEEHFPGRGEGLEPQNVYTWEESFRFRAGSYTGYGWWRRKLEEFKGGTAFQELINFADNEGAIGPVVSKKLATDFKENAEEAREFAKTLGDAGEVWLELYDEWKAAFEMASENGAVEFC
ncbi:hypothetical protein P8917_01070 [Bacillus atrophaeus]|uniref:hypothetical protein n=1 Tax=Bacillus atrophaeus TaxID=1452 RepID=UPI00227FE41A|nr:hypothetical protein [Bacillus atrophaeus]MCY8813648.1 hypothetical protein [Bacillus atrophaeus]MCY8820279.1 hypothetical protein [Bacillus atrophaeus]MCY8828597.1 hypothetical protein [Bacillus atrophaeus]MCY8832684.1 hypothetical protein [Bacillus atrophaeus]MEC0749782.1 hypothetical protein [Bacillus atrophaeus]